MQPVAKGMIQVARPTYRIVRTTHRPSLVEVAPRAAFPRDAWVTAISDRVAIPGAKTSWVGRLALG
jgi:hypothetical protein